MHYFYPKTPQLQNNDYFLQVQLADREFNTEADYFYQKFPQTVKARDALGIRKQFCDQFKKICEDTAGNKGRHDIITPSFLKTTLPQTVYVDKNKEAAFLFSILKEYCKYLDKYNFDKVYLQKQLPWIKRKQQEILCYLRKPQEQSSNPILNIAVFNNRARSIDIIKIVQFILLVSLFITIKMLSSESMAKSREDNLPIVILQSLMGLSVISLFAGTSLIVGHDCWEKNKTGWTTHPHVKNISDSLRGDIAKLENKYENKIEHVSSVSLDQ